MNIDLDTINVATILVLLLALAGAILVVVHPETLSFQQYLEDMAPFVGGLAVGRGIAAYNKKR